MRVSYHDDYVIPLPPALVPDAEVFGSAGPARGGSDRQPRQHHAPEEADWDLLGLVHTRYLEFRCGSMAMSAIRRMGFPWTQALVRRSGSRFRARSTRRMALEDGMSGNQAARTTPCPTTPRASASSTTPCDPVPAGIRPDPSIGHRPDVHQGNGTAKIFEHDQSVYTFSVHGEKNFPLRKERSTRDVPLPDHMEDADYLRAIDTHLPSALNESEPDIVFYVQGVDIVKATSSVA